MGFNGIDAKTISGWIIAILLAAFSGTLASNSRNSDLEKDNREYRVRIEALEKNQDKILIQLDKIDSRTIETNSSVIEIKGIVKRLDK